MTQPDRGDGLAVVVVDYGSSALLAVNLVQVHEQLPEALVVVVDNPTTPAERTATTALAAEHGWLLVSPERNLGFGGGVNAGVAAALERGDVTTLLLLNPDATIGATDVAALRRHVRLQSLALVGPMIRRPDGRPWSSGHELSLTTGAVRSLGRPDPADPGPTRPWLSGACLLLTVELWRAVGGFDEEYFLYWEDVDFSHRVLDVGGAIVFESEALAVHDEGGTQRDAGADTRAKSPTYYYYNIANRLRYASEHLDADGMRRWLRSSPAASWQILLRGGRRQFLKPVRPLSAAWRGHRDGKALVKVALATGAPYREGNAPGVGVRDGVENS